MAKTSIKVKANRPQNLKLENILDAKDVVDLMVYFVNLVYAVFVSENLQIKAKYLALKNQVGRKEVELW